LNSNIYDTEAGNLRITAVKCKKCGEIYFPNITTCMNCRGTETETVDLKGEGKIYSYTWVHRTPPGVPGPYCLCLIDLCEGVRVWAQVEAQEGEVKIGQPVKVCSINEKNVMKFKPEKEGAQDGTL